MKEIKENERLYLSLLNDIIKRMASNSSSCKQWTIAIVTALFTVIAVSMTMAYFIFIAIIPIAFFCWLDIYYLHLEISFRNLQLKFLDGPKDDEVKVFDFNFRKHNADKGTWKKALKSPSTLPFYLALTFVISILWALLTWGVLADFIRFISTHNT